MSSPVKETESEDEVEEEVEVHSLERNYRHLELDF